MRTSLSMVARSVACGATLLLSLPLVARSEEGEQEFVAKCGSCHVSGGEAQEFSPSFYASPQWERFFTKDKHKMKKDISGLINPDESSKIKTFLIAHAADSEKPLAIGFRRE